MGVNKFLNSKSITKSLESRNPEFLNTRRYPPLLPPTGPIVHPLIRVGFGQILSDSLGFQRILGGSGLNASFLPDSKSHHENLESTNFKNLGGSSSTSGNGCAIGSLSAGPSTSDDALETRF